MRTRSRLRWRTHQILESGIGHDPVAVSVNLLFLGILTVNELAAIVATVPRLVAEYSSVLHIIAAAAAVTFAIEYSLRLWSAVELPYLSRRRAWQARLAYALRPMALIDLAAAISAILGFLFPEVPAIQALRLIAFLKVARYSSGLQSLGLVIAEERGALLGCLLLVICLLLFTGAGIWLIEREAQPDRFATLPETLWWAIITLTTVGYGDVVPVTGAGKLFTAVMILAGIAVLALPVGVIVTGFTRIVGRREFMVTWGLLARVPLFAGLDAAAIATIMDLLHSHTYDAGEEVVLAGEPAHSMYFIAEGEVAVTLEAGEVRLGVGEFFGEMAILEGRVHRHVVTALSRCRLLILRREDFNRLGRLHPEILERVRKTAAQRRDGLQAG
ncbi:MAG TPA: cyclic nucleotide-gated ion channel [Hyphomicrobiales bacterium]|nr:cyclic nucleotide-gated ion channel [Hyphomicrobiales bacterium]